MIADWTVDVGPDSPSIDVPWEGWIDLRWERRSDAIRDLPETLANPELGPILEALNGPELFTSKVDVFAVSREEVDPEIAEAGMEQTAFGIGSYVDVLVRETELPGHFERFESVARLVAADLGKMEVPAVCLAEVVVRPARIFGEAAFGWTLYAIGFGLTHSEAKAAWASAASAVSTQFIHDVSSIAGWSRNNKTLSDWAD